MGKRGEGAGSRQRGRESDDVRRAHMAEGDVEAPAVKMAATSHTSFSRHTSVLRRDTPPSYVPIFFEATTAEATKKPADASLYLWPDCSLRDACELLWADPRRLEADLPLKAALSVSLVYPNSKGQLSLKAVGCIGRLKRGGDDDKSLAFVGYQPGDSLVVNAVNVSSVPKPPEKSMPGGQHKSPPQPGSGGGAPPAGRYSGSGGPSSRERDHHGRSERERSGRGDGPPPRSGDSKRSYSWRG